MKTELDIIRDISNRFQTLRIPFMLTGSTAMNYYATPRMTRDVDVVALIRQNDIDGLIREFSADYYVPVDAARKAVSEESMFNLIHSESVIKVDCIVRKSGEYRELEFERRTEIRLQDFTTFIVSKEDLILSKLAWAKDSRSEMQLRDVSSLIATGFDRKYVERWAKKLGVRELLDEVRGERR